MTVSAVGVPILERGLFREPAVPQRLLLCFLATGASVKHDPQRIGMHQGATASGTPTDYAQSTAHMASCQRSVLR